MDGLTNLYFDDLKPDIPIAKLNLQGPDPEYYIQKDAAAGAGAVIERGGE